MQQGPVRSALRSHAFLAETWGLFVKCGQCLCQMHYLIRRLFDSVIIDSVFSYSVQAQGIQTINRLLKKLIFCKSGIYLKRQILPSAWLFVRSKSHFTTLFHSPAFHDGPHLNKYEKKGPNIEITNRWAAPVKITLFKTPMCWPAQYECDF